MQIRRSHASSKKLLSMNVFGNGKCSEAKKCERTRQNRKECQFDGTGWRKKLD
jgi:hypothetical protein